MRTKENKRGGSINKRPTPKKQTTKKPQYKDYLDITISKPIAYSLFVITFIILAINIYSYYFTCDDAYISFRYSKNFVDGKGLVFNPGEYIEGYTNFLWVIICAFGIVLSIEPDTFSNTISILLSFGILIGIYRFYFKHYGYKLWIFIPNFLLALNPNFAMWGTSGLETQLFTFLLLMGTLVIVDRFIYNENIPSFKDNSHFTIYFILLSLTRPEGILLYGSALLGITILCRKYFKQVGFIRKGILGIFLFGLIIGGFYSWRLLYYNNIFPNTYYTHIIGFALEYGLLYLLMFILEHFYWTLIPFMAGLIFTWKILSENKRKYICLLAIISSPFFIFTIMRGGDHFEYRPFSYLLPIWMLIIVEIIRHGSKGLNKRLQFTQETFLIIILLFIILSSLLPQLVFRNLPKVTVNNPTPHVFIYNKKLRDIPVLGGYYNILEKIQFLLQKYLICTRWNIHYYFSLQQKMCADKIKLLIDRGILDSRLKYGCVSLGIIPYYTNLYFKDLHGIVDKKIASQPIRKNHIFHMNHQKEASWETLRELNIEYFIETEPFIIKGTSGIPWRFHNEPVYILDVFPDLFFLFGSPKKSINEVTTTFQHKKLNIMYFK